MERHGSARGVSDAELGETCGDRVEERQRGGAAGRSHEQVAQGKPARCRRTGCFKIGRQCRAEVGAEHEGEGTLKGDHACTPERDDEQDRRHAGMSRPGEHRRRQDGQDRLGRKRPHEAA